MVRTFKRKKTGGIYSLRFFAREWTFGASVIYAIFSPETNPDVIYSLAHDDFVRLFEEVF